MNRLFLLLLIVFLQSCSQKIESDYQSIESFLNKGKYNVNLEDFSKLVVINDKGDCIVCNNTFAKYISENISKSNTLFIISQDGTKVDISAYIDIEEPSNIIFDYKDDFSDLGIIRGSGIITLKDKEVIDVFIVTPQNIQTVNLLER